jgi:hypothetical protein
MATTNVDDKASEAGKDASELSLSNGGHEPTTRLEKITAFLKRYGIETTGWVSNNPRCSPKSHVHFTKRIDPIPPELRTDTRLFQMFFVWFSANMNVLGCDHAVLLLPITT